MAKTKKKPKMRVTSFICECPRFLKLALQGARNEILPAPEGEKGTLEHGLLEDLLNNVNKTYLEKYREPTPLLELLQRKDLIRFETEKEVIINEEDLPIIVIGHIDHFFEFPEKFVITDMKTGYWASPDDPAYRLQTELYSYIFLRDTDKPVETYLFKPQYAEMPRMEVLDPMAEIRIKAYMKKKMNFILSLENEENPKTKGGVDCKYCPYSISCPDNPFADIQKDPEGFIAELIKRKAGYTQMEKIAKEYMKEKEPIVVNGMQAGYIDSHTLKVDVAEYIKTCMEQEIQPALNVDTTIFRRQAKQNDLIANTGHYEIKPRWSIKKANKEE